MKLGYLCAAAAAMVLAFPARAGMVLGMNTGTTVDWLAHEQVNSVNVRLGAPGAGYNAPNAGAVQGTQNYTITGAVGLYTQAQNYPNGGPYTVTFNAPNPAAITVTSGGFFSGLSNVQRIGTTYTATVNLFHDGGNLLAGAGEIDLTGASVANPVTNFKIIAPGGLANPGGLTPQFAAQFNKFGGGRYMNNNNINNNVTPLSAADLLPAGQNINTAGNSIDDQINWTNQNPNAKVMFVNLPFNADKSYVQAVAMKVKAGVKPGVQVYYETGNEPWNFAFAHGGWELQQSQQDAAHTYAYGDTFSRVGEFYGILSATKMQWVQQVDPTAKGYLNSQGANQWFVDKAKEAVVRNFGAGAVQKYFGAQGISYYPADNLNFNPGSVGGLAAQVQADIPRQHGYLANDVADARRDGLKEVIYETSVMGFLTDSGVSASLVDQFLADPVAYSLTTQMLNDENAQLTQPGEGAMWFTQQGDYWGGTPNPFAPTQVTRALNDFAAANATVPEPPAAVGVLLIGSWLILARRRAA